MACVPAAKRQRLEDSDSDEKPKDLKKGASLYSNTNGMPRQADGRVLHVGIANGELANRVVIVGHVARAALLAEFLQPEVAGGEVFSLTSDRGYTTYTGLFEGKRLSVVSIGMGQVMVDFFLREARQVVEGPMAVVRFGTCGLLKASASVGSVSVASEGSILIQRNYSAFPLKDGEQSGDKCEGYHISSVCPSDPVLSKAVLDALKMEVGESNVLPGVNATADSFYSSQGRRDPYFPDGNEELISEVIQRHPGLTSCEMESYMLLHLAQCARPAGCIRACAAAVNCANRHTGEVVGGELLKSMERNGGKAIMKALKNLEL